VLLQGVDPKSVVELASNPRLFIPLWPFLESFDIAEDNIKATLVLKRFGFKMRVNYSIEVVTGDNSVLYKCTAPGKELIVIINAEPSNDGSKVTIESRYTGEFESFSQPLLNEFVETIMNKLRTLVSKTETKPLSSTEISPLSNQAFLARVVIKGKVVGRQQLQFQDEGSVSSFLQNIAELSKNKPILVRLTSPGGGTCIRLYLRDGEVVDALFESGSTREQGVGIVERLLDLLRGEWSALIIEVPESLRQYAG
jgi:hypothetical protein